MLVCMKHMYNIYLIKDVVNFDYAENLEIDSAAVDELTF